ncbi:MAG: class I SAM-dependent methyltransferase [Rubrobacter sp.]|nr:class I SAM-dependent methyltransferase [Rubrobacter sp.]
MNRRDHPESTTADKQDLPSLIGIYFSTRSWFQKAGAAAQACFVGLWLGVLSPDRLYATVEEYYTRSGRRLQGHHDYHSKEYNRGGLFDWEKHTLTGYFGDCKDLLVLGAGGGREILALLRLGYQVDGFESHPALVVAANELLREEGFDPAVHLIAPDESPSAGTTYDGIVVGWGMYMSIQTRRRRIAFLQQLRTKTRARGPILLSFFPRDGADRRYHVSASVANMIRRMLRREPTEVGDSLEPFYVHHFTQDELTSELAEGGFDTVYYDTWDYGHAVGTAV